MRLFSYAAFRFDHPEQKGESFTIDPMKTYENAPEWIRQSTMFNLAVKAKKLLVAESKFDMKVIEATAGDTIIPDKTPAEKEFEQEVIDDEVVIDSNTLMPVVVKKKQTPVKTI